ncbi:MAG: 6-carboxytetrahydropterin synthase [Candidatus Brocadiales bacterium]|nr:6-carboxytetrahydropterin synthase [Candidatus Bathyanammoxibius sp.]
MNANDQAGGLAFSIAKDFHFAAAHRLLHLPIDHKCSHLHGHNYIVRTVFEGEVDDRGFVIDYGELDPLKQIIDQKFDHRVLIAESDLELIGLCTSLNTNVAVLPIENTSAEYLAKYLYDQFHKSGFEVSQILISETPKTWAIYPIHSY